MLEKAKSQNGNQTNFWLVGNFISFFLTLFVNYLGGSGLINDMSQQEVSAKYTTLITPAGFAFSIWGVIYTMVLITLIYLAFKRDNQKIMRTISLISPLFIISCFFNMGWIFSFSYELIGLSVVMIFLLLLALMKLIEKINYQSKDISYALPAYAFTLYAAWVLIATFLNISIFFVKIGWNGFGISDSVWSLVVITIAIVFVVGYVFMYKNAFFPISIAWAFYGIYSNYEEGVHSPNLASSIKILLLVGLAILVITAIYRFVMNKNSIFPKTELSRH
ncbi:TspO/MBR family protein [Facklamia sp. 7083-14-GEN3]|uniref:TspO/MBR family protein n=1 Tax=Facklamia sp. 7083-14-GEN3 TaxID=2973478 RepID=UPI00215CCD99|nr:TspO/MBR family protein [Facklamia sp. 7083-14-GEN3]MCR8969364.1 tryptophan-rich sensory protein [Facklamia sp. 7083-14-GEN3]